MRHGRRGAALLEVMIALTLLLGAGVTLVGLLSASLRSETGMRAREARYAELDRLLTAMSLLSRADLDRRLGRHTVGTLTADVQRPESRLYRIAVSAADAPGTEALVTVVYRPEEVAR